MFFWQSWAIEFKGWKICRIDGSTKPLDRREEMARFQNGGDDPNAPKLFLLSTRAGGLGINLTAADTVIFYDQDWVCSRPLLLHSLSLKVEDEVADSAAIESTNGHAGPGPRASHRADEARSHFPHRHRAYDRKHHYGTCERKAATRGARHCQGCVSVISFSPL